MYDINFFQKTYKLKKDIVSYKYYKNDIEYIHNLLESFRSSDVNIFNIETTNNCNMTCVMCPRTTEMTRKITVIGDTEFDSLLKQVRPHSKVELDSFLKFVNDEYGINELSRDENAFYFYVSSACITLHGYGEPLIDPNIIKRIAQCKAYNIPTYFSCVPANIDVEKILKLMQEGLTVIKFSIDSLDDMRSKKIRGKHNNFTNAYEKIKEIIDLKAVHKYPTSIVCTMLALSTDEESIKEQHHFLELWKGEDVFAYIKSLDNRWYNDLDEKLENKSHYEQQYCEYPWTSLTVMSNGDIVPCTQDYDCLMSFGNIKEKSLEEVWNSKEYNDFRQWHIDGNFPMGHKCASTCDQKKVYNYLNV